MQPIPDTKPDLVSSYVTTGFFAGLVLTVVGILVQVAIGLNFCADPHADMQLSKTDSLALSAVLDVFIIPLGIGAVIAISAVSLLFRSFVGAFAGRVRLGLAAVGGMVGGAILAHFMAEGTSASTTLIAFALLCGGSAVLGATCEVVFVAQQKRAAARETATEEVSVPPGTMAG